MELVIKLDDETYKQAINRTEFDTLSLGLEVIEAVQNGTPLPKGHGDLIDRDALIYNADYYEPLISKRDVDFAPTIIEGSESG